MFVYLQMQPMAKQADQAPKLLVFDHKALPEDQRGFEALPALADFIQRAKEPFAITLVSKEHIKGLHRRFASLSLHDFVAWNYFSSESTVLLATVLDNPTVLQQMRSLDLSC